MLPNGTLLSNKKNKLLVTQRKSQNHDTGQKKPDII